MAIKIDQSISTIAPDAKPTILKQAIAIAIILNLFNGSFKIKLPPNAVISGHII